MRTQDQTKLLESIAHAKKYLLPFKDSYPKEVQQACGLLAFPPGTRAATYGVRFLQASTEPDLTAYRSSTANPDGRCSPISSCKHTTICSPSRPSHFSTLRSQPVSPPSKRHLATRRTYPPYHPLHLPQSPPLSAPFAVRSLTTSHGTSHTHIIRRVMLRATWCSYRMDAHMGDIGWRSTAGKRGWARI